MPLSGFLRMTRRHTVAYKPFEVVVVPFPFTDRKTNKRRPALILSDDIKFNTPSGHAVLAMINRKTAVIYMPGLAR